MNFDKTLILIWILLGSILVVENLVTWLKAYVFLWTSMSTWVLSLFSIFIWMMIGYGMRWKFKNGSKDNDDDWEDYDF